MKLLPSSLIRRVVWAVTATVAVLVGLQSVLAYTAMSLQEDELSDELLSHESQRWTQELEAAGVPANGLGPIGTSRNVSAFLTRGEAGAAAVPAFARSLGPGAYELDVGAMTWHVAVSDIAEGRLVVVLDATRSEDRVTRFGWTLSGIWLACVGVTVWIARLVARVAVEPVVAATRLIASWSPGPTASGGADVRVDEAAALVEAFNRFRDGMDGEIAREREFAANLDHEIRTPLTSIRTDAELLAIDGPLTPPQGARAARIARSVDEIIATAEAARRLSAGRFAPPEPVRLSECVRVACESMQARADERGLRIRVDIAASGVEMVVDRQALLTVVRNIVRNAVEHAAPALFTVSQSGDTIRFEDDGPGVAPEALPYIFERWYRGHRRDADAAVPTEGTVDEAAAPERRGLGLAIARRLCDLNGWTLGVVSPCTGDRGTRFVLDLSAVH